MPKARRGLPKSATMWIAVTVAVVIVLVLLNLSTISAYLGASLLGPDVATKYSPLVRHQISQRHCYDNGSQFCEQNFGGGFQFDKEFTVAYLFASRPSIASTPLYSCTNTKVPGETYRITTKRAECNRAKLSSFVLGHVATAQDFEAPVALWRCLKNDTSDPLVTDDPNECALSEYAKPTLLGYAATAGYLPSRRLGELCTVAQRQCNAGDSQMCNAHASYCEDSDTVSEPVPTSPPTTSVRPTTAVF